MVVFALSALRVSRPKLTLFVCDVNSFIAKNVHPQKYILSQDIIIYNLLVSNTFVRASGYNGPSLYRQDREIHVEASKVALTAMLKSWSGEPPPVIVDQLMPE